jgi:hypothetical protein
MVQLALSLECVCENSFLLFAPFSFDFDFIPWSSYLTMSCGMKSKSKEKSIKNQITNFRRHTLNVFFPCLYSRISSKPLCIFSENVLMALLFFNFFDEFFEYCVDELFDMI